MQTNSAYILHGNRAKGRRQFWQDLKILLLYFTIDSGKVIAMVLYHFTMAKYRYYNPCTVYFLADLPQRTDNITIICDMMTFWTTNKSFEKKRD